MKKTILKLLIITFIISAILGILIILLDLWNDLTGKILLTTVTIFGFSIPGLACSTNYEKVKNKLISTIGMITCFVSGIYFILLIWGVINFDLVDDLIFKLMFTCILLSLSFGHLCLILLIESEDKNVNYVKFGTIVLAIILDLLLLVSIFIEIELNWKLFLIVAILTALGTIVTPLLNKLNSKSNVSNMTVVEDKYTKLDKLKKLLDNNAITQEEYEIEKKKILND